jgi:hypothetical protein
MAVLNQLNAAFIPVYNAQVPKEGPKAIPFSVTFAKAMAGLAVLDLSQQMDQGKISMIQSIYVDTSLTDSRVIITVNGHAVPLTVKGRTQGWYPLVAPNPLVVSFNCQGVDSIVSFILLNTPIAPAQWSTQ